MAAKNQVTLTFAGDTAQLEDAFDRVGAGAQAMGRDVGSATDGFERAMEASDTAEGRFQGFASSLTGTRDVVQGFGATMSGNVFEGLVTVGGGAADLAEGFNYTLIPALKSAVTWLGQTKVGTLAVAAAKKIWTAAQWLLNTALLANPIVLIIVAIIALIAIIVLIATKTTWFQDLWRVVWTNVKKWALGFWDWIKNLPSMLASAFKNLVNIITAPWRTAFNAIAKLWNNTVGKLSFSVPSWAPGIGGQGFSMPKIPTFHSGGIVPGPPGAEVLALLQSGERVTPRGGFGGGTTLAIERGAGTSVDQMVSTLVLYLIRTGALKLVVRDGRVAVS